MFYAHVTSLLQTVNNNNNISRVPFTTPHTSNPRHVKPQTHQTPDTSNLRHIKPQTKNIGLPTTQQIKIPFQILIEILFENLKINRIFTWNIKRYFICCVVGSPIFLDVSEVWCVWGLMCLGFNMSGVVNGPRISTLWIPTITLFPFLGGAFCDWTYLWIPSVPWS